MFTDAQTDASSASPTESPSFTAFEAAQNALDRGIAPEPTTTDAKPAESSPAPAAEQPASTEVKPDAASEPAQPRKTAEDRKRELAADIENGLKRRHAIREEIAREEARLQTLRQPVAPQVKPDARPDSSPAPATFPTYDEFMALPGNEDKLYEHYLDERADHRFEQRAAARERESQEKARHEQQAKAREERNTKFSERLDAAGGLEFVKTCSAEVQNLRPFDAIARDAQGRLLEQPSGYHAIAGELMSSDVVAAVMRHFTDHPDEFHAMAKLQPDALFRAFGRLEARLSGTPAPPVAPPKTVSTAPPPPDTLGKRPAAGADPVESAIARQDFGAYERETNKRDLAARSGRR